MSGYAFGQPDLRHSESLSETLLPAVRGRIGAEPVDPI